VDCTVVESNIHAPYDSQLLVDANRVLARLLSEAKSKLPDIIFSFTDLRRIAKPGGGLLLENQFQPRRRLSQYLSPILILFARMDVILTMDTKFVSRVAHQT
jgi:hypothetical protein